MQISKNMILKRLSTLMEVAKSDSGQKRIDDEFDNKMKSAKGAKGFLNKAKTLYNYFRDPNTSKSKKALIGAGLLYFIIPVDLVSDFIPILGYVDDGVALTYIWSLVSKELKEYEMNEDVIDITSEVEIIDEDIEEVSKEIKDKMDAIENFTTSK